MNIRRVLAVAAIPFVIGTFGFVAPNQANAQPYPIATHRLHNNPIDPMSNCQDLIANHRIGVKNPVCK